MSRQQVGVSCSERVPYTVRGFFGLHSASEASAFLQRLRACVRPLSCDRPPESVSWIGLLVFFVRDEAGVVLSEHRHCRGQSPLGSTF